MTNQNQIVITSALRTAIGSFGGSLASKTAPELGSEVIKGCINHSHLKANDVDVVYMGQVLTTGIGQNPARQAAIYAGISKDKTATTINQVCGSGLASIALAFNSIKCGDGNVMIAGGQESMSNAPHFVNLRNGLKMGSGTLSDSMIIDGLWDIYNNYHMGVTAENVAKKYQITREDQDSFALSSQKKASNAIKAICLKYVLFPAILGPVIIPICLSLEMIANNLTKAIVVDTFLLSEPCNNSLKILMSGICNDGHRILRAGKKPPNCLRIFFV